jgi:hypothetical protein
VHSILIWFARFFCLIAIVVFYGHFEIQSPWWEFLFLEPVDGIVESTSKRQTQQWHSQRDRFEIGVSYRYEVKDVVFRGVHRSFDLKDGFDHLAPGDSINAYIDVDTPQFGRLRPAWKWSNLVSLGYAFMVLVPAMFLAASFERARRVLAFVSHSEGVPWRWGVRTFGLFFLLTALSVRGEQVRALLAMQRVEAKVTDRQRQIVSNHLAFTTISYTYEVDGTTYDAAFRTNDHGSTVYTAHPSDMTIGAYVDGDDHRISVVHIDTGAAILSCILLAIGTLIVLLSYPLGWRLVGMVIQRVLDRRIASEQGQAPPE